MLSKFDNFFYSKGINVMFNTLGYTNSLVEAYVDQFADIVNTTISKQSNHVKHSCYNKLYDIEFKQKYTGFENFKNLDQKFRKKISPFIKDKQFSPYLVLEKNSELVKNDYKNLLKQHLRTIHDPVLYFSGGIDSELVAKTFLDIGIKFKVVIFKYVDDEGAIKNFHDIKYAYNFCESNNITPYTYEINIEKLWGSLEFEKLAIDIGYVSPQLTTYAYMVQIVSEKFPTSTHLFGGEIRFNTNYLLDNNQSSNLVYLEKVCPPGYGSSYSTITDPYDGTLYLNYFGSGAWEVAVYTNQPYYNQFASGLWTNTPNVGYEFRITNVIVYQLQGQGTVNPPSPTGWTAIDPNATYNTICSVSVLEPTLGQFNSRFATFYIELRDLAQTGICYTELSLELSSLNV